MTAPKLRFKEFTLDWSTVSLGSLFTKRRDKGVDNVPTYSVTLNDGIINREDLERETTTNLSAKEHLLVKKNDLAYNMMRMWQGALGLAPTDGIVSPAYVVLKPNEQKTDSSFFEYYFKRNRQIHNFWAYSQGLTEDRLRLYFDDFKVIRINAPSKEEQTKIATFLTAVDEKISQLSQKLHLLGQYKQGMMQKLFSQQIRFKADDGSEFGEWGEQKLGEVSTTFSGGTPQSTNKDFYQGTIPFIKSGEISQKTTEQFINEIALKSSSAKLVQKGDLLYALYGATSGQVAISQIDGAINQAILCIRSNLNTLYLLNFFLLKKDSILSTYLQGGQGNLSAAILKEILVPIPCLEEQTKIANFLSSIDQKIDVVSEQLEQAKLWKKGLLQQMFV
nr:restriction endonuclease subunit S [Acinetobacter sp. TUM15509]